MKAFAILDGGGVKGAALVGALKAASDRDVHFVGYGGTSAGAIVATLAAIGHTPAELEQVIVNKPFTEFLDDGTGRRLDRLVACFRSATEGALLLRPLKIGWSGCRNALFLRSWSKRRGLYDGRNVRKFLAERIATKLPALIDPAKVTFADLKKVELAPHEKYAPGRCWPLKIVASDITDRTSYVFPDDSGDSWPVLDAVLASMAYPLVFHPVSVGARKLVDGGLCSNLPAFLFEEQARKHRLPVIAIDLELAPVEEDDTFGTAIRQMVDTALDASDKLVRSLVDVHHVRVRIEPPVGAMAFDLDDAGRRTLFQNGEVGYNRHHNRYFAPLENADDVVAKLQVRYGHPDLVLPILDLIAQRVEEATDAQRVRVHVTLPTLEGDRVVTYQFGMDGMPDRTLRLAEFAGCSGKAAAVRDAVFARVHDIRTHFADWGLTAEQRDRISKDVESMLSVPIFDTSGITPEKATVDVTTLPVIGSLSIDSVTPPDQTGWLDPTSQDEQVVLDEELILFLRQWADIIGMLLS